MPASPRRSIPTRDHASASLSPLVSSVAAHHWIHQIGRQSRSPSWWVASSACRYWRATASQEASSPSHHWTTPGSLSQRGSSGRSYVLKPPEGDLPGRRTWLRSVAVGHVEPSKSVIRVGGQSTRTDRPGQQEAVEACPATPASSLQQPLGGLLVRALASPEQGHSGSSLARKALTTEGVLQEALRRYFGEPVYEPSDEERRLLDDALTDLDRQLEASRPWDEVRTERWPE